MILEPKAGFESAIRIADAVNPVLVIASIIGLFLEYTGLKPFVLLPNQIISVIFVADFLLRMVSYPLRSYFFRGYGWIDFLASIPGILVILGNTPFLSLFKIVRVGRFFKILRVLRFLRVFSFLKQMKADSAWIQDRIMKIGVSVVLVFIGGIIATDSYARMVLEAPLRAEILADWELSGQDQDILVKANPDILGWTKNGLPHFADGTAMDPGLWVQALGGDEGYIFELNLEPGFTSTEGFELPTTGLLINSTTLLNHHNGFMLILLTCLVGMLLVIIFYLGYLFARDMKTVQLVVDSVDADDYYLLLQEADKHRDEFGELVIGRGEDEMTQLLKMAAKLAALQESGGAYSMSESPKSTVGISDESLAALEARLEGRARAIAVEAVKLSAPAILKYLKANTKP